MTCWRWLPLLLLACAGAKAALVPAAARQEPLPGPSLPQRLDREPGLELALDASERRLVASKRVQITRKAYGPTQVALVTSAGLKELHPPTTCLKSAGYQVTRAEVVQSAVGCLHLLTVRPRHSDEALTFAYTYFTREAATCSLWRRASSAGWGMITGAPVAWSSIQALDRDPQRAQQILTRLLSQLRRPAAQPPAS